jgi:hypothetical protein
LPIFLSFHLLPIGLTLNVVEVIEHPFLLDVRCAPMLRDGIFFVSEEQFFMQKNLPNE